MVYLWSCNYAAGQQCDNEGVLHYNYADIVEILDNKNCNTCHSPTGQSPEWTYNTYEGITSRGNCDLPLIVHGDASKSLLFDKINGGLSTCGLPMPLVQFPLSQEEVHSIESWINNGATESCAPLYDDIVTTLSKYNCGDCHNFNSTWSPLSYDHITGKSGSNICGNIVIRQDAKASTLYQLISDGIIHCDEDIPTHEPISKDDAAVIRDWINSGTLEGIFSLPVELTLFEVKSNDANAIDLTWASATEIATDKYILQRSKDGYDFESIHESLAVGTSNEITNYEYTDRAGLYGKAYYRLLILDLDGTFIYSNIISIYFVPNGELLTISPNILKTGDNMIVTWQSTIERPYTYATIMDSRGQKVFKIGLSSGENMIRTPILENGMYYIIVENYFDSFQIERFVIMK